MNKEALYLPVKKTLRNVGIGAAALAVISGVVTEFKHIEPSYTPHTEQKTVERVIFRAKEHQLSKPITKSNRVI
jgi:hypothetical protein